VFEISGFFFCAKTLLCIKWRNVRRGRNVPHRNRPDVLAGACNPVPHDLCRACHQGEYKTCKKKLPSNPTGSSCLGCSTFPPATREQPCRPLLCATVL